MGEAEGPRGAGRAALANGAARGGNAAALSWRNPPAPAERREVSHLAVKDSKTGTEREISASLSFLFCKRSTSCFPPNSSSITFKEDRTLQTFFYFIYVCVHTHITTIITDRLSLAAKQFLSLCRTWEILLSCQRNCSSLMSGAHRVLN